MYGSYQPAKSDTIEPANENNNSGLFKKKMYYVHFMGREACTQIVLTKQSPDRWLRGILEPGTSRTGVRRLSH